MNTTRSIIFIITLLLTVTFIQAKSIHPLSSNDIKDYTKYLVSMLGIENEYARFLSYLKIYPLQDNDNLRVMYENLFSSDAYISDIAQMYDKYYTTEEILQLIQFYSSPLGKKTIEVNNILNHQMDDLMLTKVTDYIFTAAEHDIHIPLPEIK